MASQRFFSTGLRMHLMDKFTRLDAKSNPGTNEFSMQINLVSPAALKFTKDTPLTYFKDTLLASGAS
jgi:hypothetical protein